LHTFPDEKSGSPDFETRCSELTGNSRNGIHMLKIPVLYFLAGASDRITKKKGAEIRKYKTSKSRQEKEPVLWDFPAPSH